MTQATRPPATGSSQPVHGKALLFDYRLAANPVRRGLTEPIPEGRWGPDLHAAGPTAIIPLDLSAGLGCQGPATSPALSANFVRILPGEGLPVGVNATSSLFFVLRGEGCCHRPSAGQSGAFEQAWATGDLFVLPAGVAPRLEATAESVLYWVHDEPLLSFLGVRAESPRFVPTHYPAAWLRQELEALAADPTSARSNRLSLLLANTDLPLSRTVTHTLWAMYGLLPAGAVQPPHRHQSVALDLVIDCQPGCTTLSGPDLNPDGTIRNPLRMEWEAGAAFVTPPGHWHSHVNESGHPALLLPIQDAGLHTYLRSLDIRFSSGLEGD
ncbi:cupin [Synechococcus sp. CS-1325]|uniref:cupin n=1 Tax=Synechococcus sp. CS-1325 TaxID=2847979 RepID=UPI000DB847CC|nr:cupin [Synechococcus sp. CS-1325]MCT0199678.1 cupin [Synechococcus sp. CS-1325]PZV00316.1 MAG: cupin [Cyanobium sp.]